MPIYIYQNPETKEEVEIIQSMNEDHVYFDKSGLEWKRVFTSSQLSTNGSIDPWSSNQFVEKTRNQKGTYGDLLDQSAELSQKRADQNGGLDPIKQKAYDNYAKKRNGARHPQEIREKKSKIQKKNISIEY